MSRANMLRILCVVLILSSVCSALIESNFYREETCSNATGFCLLPSECPSNLKILKNLCSSQAGAICCQNFPQEDVNCHQLHNACGKGCERNLGRKGCANGEVCCVLL